MNDSEKQEITVLDATGRRRFIRNGAAFVVAGGSFAATPTVYADDCDRNAGSEKNAQAPNSDSDQGAEADPMGCGRSEPPKISQKVDSTEHTSTVKVKKIKA